MKWWYGRCTVLYGIAGGALASRFAIHGSCWNSLTGPLSGVGVKLRDSGYGLFGEMARDNCRELSEPCGLPSSPTGFAGGRPVLRTGVRKLKPLRPGPPLAESW